MKRTILTLLAAAATSLGLQTAPASAQQFWIGQIIPGGWNFCPRSTTQAAGQLLAISSHSALFSLYGTMYGGDGRTTFGLPDLRGRTPIGYGNGPGLSAFREGQKGGVETVTLNNSTMPSHTHTATSTATSAMAANAAGAASADATGKGLSSNAAIYSAQGAPGVAMRDGVVTTNVQTTLGNTGGNVPFGIRDPYQAINFCVVLEGIFPLAQLIGILHARPLPIANGRATT